MMKQIICFSIVSMFLFYYCSEELVNANKVYEIEIVEPAENFVLGQGSEVIIKLRVENIVELVKVNLYHILQTISSEQDTFVRELFNEPFIDTTLTGYEICIDSLQSKFIAIAIYSGGREVNSNTVSGIAISEIPLNINLLMFEYQGFDLDSNLVAEGLIYVNYDSTRSDRFAGRRYINHVYGDSAYEVGYSNFISDGGLGKNNEFQMWLTYCTDAIYKPSLYISGIWNDTLLAGDRFTYMIGGPHTRIDLGTYTARRK